ERAAKTRGTPRTRRPTTNFMLAIFCLRLACGLAACLLLLSPAQVNPRFFRVQFLTVLGLTAVAAFFLRETAPLELWLALGGAAAVAFVGSITWHVEGAPLARVLMVLAGPLLAAALLLTAWQRERVAPGWLMADHLTSAALLGSATTAMLMGHSYLI